MSNKSKYKPSKAGKIAIGAMIVFLIAGMLFMNFTSTNYRFLFAASISFLLSQIALLFWYADMINFQKINHPDSSNSNENIALTIVIVILINLLWRKIL